MPGLEEHQMTRPKSKLVAIGLAAVIFGGAAPAIGSSHASAYAVASAPIIDSCSMSPNAQDASEDIRYISANYCSEVKGAPCAVTCSNYEIEPFGLIEFR
jgi:hypothetical protein